MPSSNPKSSPKTPPSPGSGPLSSTPRPKADPYIWAIFVFLLLVSVVELYSASSREITNGQLFAPLIRHGRMLGIGVLLAIGISYIPYKWFRLITPLFALAAVLLGIYVMFKGDIINGARRSTTLLGIPLQPAELLKLAVVLVIAMVMSINQIRHDVTTKGVVICAAFVLLASGLLIFQGLTNTLLLMGISFAMMLIGGVSIKKFLCVLAVYALLGGVAIGLKEHNEAPTYSAAEEQYITETGHDFAGNARTIKRSGTWKGRMSRYFGDSVPKYDQPLTSENRQEMFSYMAQANGGLTGKIPGNGREASRLPLAFSDYIFAICVEDWGFIGGMLLLGAYLVLLARAGFIAGRCTRAFPALLVLGMAVLIVLQALFHMAIVTGVFPVSGQPLPLISKGGSSIIATSIAFGIMQSVSRYAVRNNSPNKKEKEDLSSLPPELSAANPMQIKP